MEKNESISYALRIFLFLAWILFFCIVSTAKSPLIAVQSSTMVKVRCISFWLLTVQGCVALSLLLLSFPCVHLHALPTCLHYYRRESQVAVSPFLSPFSNLSCPFPLDRWQSSFFRKLYDFLALKGSNPDSSNGYLSICPVFYLPPSLSTFPTHAPNLSTPPSLYHIKWLCQADAFLLATSHPRIPSPALWS